MVEELPKFNHVEHHEGRYVRLSEEMVKYLDRVSSEHGITPNELLNLMLQKSRKHIDIEKDGVEIVARSGNNEIVWKFFGNNHVQHLEEKKSQA